MARILLYFFALFCLSTSPNWARLNQMPAEVLGFWRLLIATLALSLFVLYQKKETLFTLHKKNIWVILSGFFFFLHLWTYKYAAKNTLISNTMILFSTNPIWASLGSSVFFKEKITPRMIFSYLLAVVGVLLLVYNQLDFSVEHQTGNRVALISAFFYAAYMLTGKKARESFSTVVYSTHIYGITAACFFIATLATNKSIFAPTPMISWVAVLGLVALPTFFGHFSMSYLLNYMNLSVMTCGKLLEPLIASFIAYLLFAETLGPQAYWAFALTSLAVLNLFWPQIQKSLKSTQN